MRTPTRLVTIGSAFITAAFAMAAMGAESHWPPEAQIEMRVPFEPTAFPADGRNYLVYELRITNLSKAGAGIRRLEVRDATASAAQPFASYEGEQLDQVLQHFGNPAVGDRMPTAEKMHRELAPGESTIVFLTIVVERNVPVPARLVHRLYTTDARIDGASVGTRHVQLATLAAPLAGSWQAFSGAGDNESHHRRQFLVLGGRASQSGRFAIDWKRMKDGVSFAGAEDDNASYFSFGQSVFAVADGRVVAVRDGIRDNSPGHVGAEALGLTLENIAGNLVVLDIGNGQFAYYAHLKPGSLRVATSQQVRRGEIIGQVGNSGSSFEPHLHFEVTDSPLPIRGEGLPYVFKEFLVLTSAGPQHRRNELPLKGSIVDFGATAP